MGALSSSLMLFGIVLLYGVAGNPALPAHTRQHALRRTRRVPRRQSPQLPRERRHRPRALRRRFQDRRVPLSDMGARRLPRRAHARDRVPRRFLQSRRLHRTARARRHRLQRATRGWSARCSPSSPPRRSSSATSPRSPSTTSSASSASPGVSTCRVSHPRRRRRQQRADGRRCGSDLDLSAYLLASFAVFGVVAHVAGANDADQELDHYAGLANTHPFLALALAVGLGSLAGIPPLVGFIGSSSSSSPLSKPVSTACSPLRFSAS